MDEKFQSQQRSIATCTCSVHIYMSNNNTDNKSLHTALTHILIQVNQSKWREDIVKFSKQRRRTFNSEKENFEEIRKRGLRVEYDFQ